MADLRMHVVSFDVPYPADYGGVIDVFYKLKALSEAGIKIRLHCFQYGRKAASELESICEAVFYYPRKKIYTGIVSRVPYIVGSRINPDLLERLSSDDCPVLFEGLHTCAYLDHPLLEKKVKGVRMHNVEWQYYRGLFDHSTETLKTIYYAVESKRLQRFESVLVHANHIFAISKTETEYLESRFPQTILVFPFHGVGEKPAAPGFGSFMLYHGNLSVPENEEAVEWLVKHISPEPDFPLIIAGKKPGPAMKALLAGRNGFELVENPGEARMTELISQAHIHLMPAFQSTGVKLKLLRSLFQGRHVLTNRQMLEGTGLAPACELFKRPKEIADQLKQLRARPFTEDDYQNRIRILSGFDDRAGARAIIRAMFPESLV